MAVIDADAHSIETDRTWTYLEEAERQFAPVGVATANANEQSGGYWLIDGKVRSRLGNVGKMFPKESRELTDVSARLRHMDELGIDVQVIYPSILTQYTQKREVEAAFCKTYNRWMADVWGQSNNRLRWACILPLMDIEKSREELRFARDHGACAIFARSFEGDRQLIDPYFFPLYEEAQSLNVPVCVHASLGNSTIENLLTQGKDGGNFLKFKLSVIGAFHQIVTNALPEQFPTLRFGFVGTSSQWVPYVLHDLLRRFAWKGWTMGPDLMRDYRLFVACQTDDDLPYVLQYAGEDNLMCGTDYGHADTSTEMEALSTLRKRTDVEPRILNKILDDNPRALYGI